MSRRRFTRPQGNFNRGPATNERIRATHVFLIDENNEKVGEVPLIEALRRSFSAGLDLVEVAPDASPPVCRILNFGKYKYEQSKKDRVSKAKTKTAELKEIRLGRSMKIGPHDIELRLQQARRFLIDGHRVQITQTFRGREVMHKKIGEDRMKDIIEKLADISKVELAPRMYGRRMNVMLAPDKPKIEAYKRRQQAIKAKSKPEGTDSVNKDADEKAASKPPATKQPAEAKQ